MQTCLRATELCGHCEPWLWPYGEWRNCPLCSACSKFCLEKPWVGLGGSRAANIWCLGTSECKTKISADPEGDGASPLQKSPVRVKGFTVNPGTQPVSPVFYNLVLLYIIPKLCISGTKSARSQVNCKSQLSQIYQNFSGIWYSC